MYFMFTAQQAFWRSTESLFSKELTSIEAAINKAVSNGQFEVTVTLRDPKCIRYFESLGYLCITKPHSDDVTIWWENFKNS